MQFTILVESSVVILNIIHLVCLIYAWEKRRFLNILPFSLYDLYGHALAQETLPRGYEIYNFARPLLGHHYFDSIDKCWLIHCLLSPHSS